MSESDVKLAALSNQITLQQKLALDELSFIKKAQSEVYGILVSLYLPLMLDNNVRDCWVNLTVWRKTLSLPAKNVPLRSRI